MSIKLISFLIIVIIVFMLFVYIQLKKKRISIKYSLIWFITSIFMILAALNYNLMKNLANLLGIETPSNMVFFFLIGILMVIIFFMSATISRLNDRTIILAEEIAILKKVKNDK